MKFTLRFLLFFILTVSCFSTKIFGQISAGTKDYDNLIAVAELYSHDPNGFNDKFIHKLDSLRTPQINNIVEALITLGKKDFSILQNKFMTRPENDELKLWYIIREIHYNRVSKTTKGRTDKEIVDEILNKNIDERWLLDNYYYNIKSAISFLFNEADLSGYNFDINQLKLRNNTEKGIFFLNIMSALTQRFRVLISTKNFQRIFDFAKKLPTYNGKKYFYYNDFDYDDFDWVGYEKTESYNIRHISVLYETLLANLAALSNLGLKDEAKELYFNSILSKPQYFKYTSIKNVLEDLYNKFQKIN